MVRDAMQGLELMREFGDELEEHMKMREQLVLAEKLFDMPLTSYPELGTVEASMKKLSQIYDVYKGHVDAVASYSSMLWSELDINKMTQSTEDVMLSLKKLKHLKTVPTYEMVEHTIQGFQHSLPLMADLKSEALRKRHWDQLMHVTGRNFDMDPKTFTLANMFAMNLSQYIDQISEITSAAVKELTIESELKKLAEVWKEQKFSVAKYSKVRVFGPNGVGHPAGRVLPGRHSADTQLGVRAGHGGQGLGATCYRRDLCPARGHGPQSAKHDGKPIRSAVPRPGTACCLVGDRPGIGPSSSSLAASD